MNRLLAILALAATLFVSQSHAAALSDAQKSTLKAAALADPTAAGYILVTGDDIALRGWFNADTSYVLWRTSLTRAELFKDPAFDWTRVDNLTIGKARIADWQFSSGSINCTEANIRAGIDATWVGTAADLAVRASVYAKCKRLATRAESFLGVGSGTTLSPSVPQWEGIVSGQDVIDIRNAP